MEFIVTQIEEILYNGELMGYQCFDGTGQSVKVKKGQGGHLQAKWEELQVGRAYSFTMGEYNGKPFVENFESMSDVLADKLPPIVKEAVKMGAEVVSVTTKPPSDPKNRSYALSYAKDLAMAGKVEVDKIKAWAIKFAKYLDTGA